MSIYYLYKPHVTVRVVPVYIKGNSLPEFSLGVSEFRCPYIPMWFTFHVGEYIYSMDTVCSLAGIGLFLILIGLMIWSYQAVKRKNKS